MLLELQKPIMMILRNTCPILCREVCHIRCVLMERLCFGERVSAATDAAAGGQQKGMWRMLEDGLGKVGKAKCSNEAPASDFASLLPPLLLLITHHY